MNEEEQEHLMLSYYDLHEKYYKLQQENKQLKKENKKIKNILYKYRRNINNLYSYLYDKDGIAIICDIKKLFEILGDEENE